MNINSVADLKNALRAGEYAWPGGYPCYFITSNGEALSFDGCLEQLKTVMEATSYPDDRSGWGVVGVEVNWEDPDLFCAHTSKRIKSAYAEPEAETETTPDPKL